jgi:hypothetical protein
MLADSEQVESAVAQLFPFYQKVLMSLFNPVILNLNFFLRVAQIFLIR